MLQASQRLKEASLLTENYLEFVDSKNLFKAKLPLAFILAGINYFLFCRVTPTIDIEPIRINP